MSTTSFALPTGEASGPWLESPASEPFVSDSTPKVRFNQAASEPGPEIIIPSELLSLTSSPRRQIVTPKEQTGAYETVGSSPSGLHATARYGRTTSNWRIFSSPTAIGGVSGALDLAVFSTGSPTATSTISPDMALSYQYCPSPCSWEYLRDFHSFSAPFQLSPDPNYIVSTGYLPTYNGAGELSGRTSSLPISPATATIRQVPITTASSNPAARGGNHALLVENRPRPRCWDHGCGGRPFSTSSNLIRHQREKSRQATKILCPNCGALFTRVTACKQHLLHYRCKQAGGAKLRSLGL